MAIPDLLPCGLLPPGMHPATMADVEAAFGRSNDRRIHLAQKLAVFVRLAQTFGLFPRILIDGSFVTDKADPGDIDVVLDLGRSDLPRLLRHPQAGEIINRPFVKAFHEVDCLFQDFGAPPPDGGMVDLFQRLRPRDRVLRKVDISVKKGVVCVTL